LLFVIKFLKSLNKNIVKTLLILAIFCLPFLNGCENNLSDEGIGYISGDTLGTLILDSQRDTVQISSNNFIKYINTSSSANMLVGKYSNYESKTLLRFTGISSSYDTSTVLSAKLNLRYNKTFYQDSLGIISFNIYRLGTYYDFSTLTYDAFNNSSIGSNILGTYTGTPTDTSLISITLDNQTVKDWLKYAYDTNYVNKNYGIALLSNGNSSTIKAFCSPNYTLYSGFTPSVTVVLHEPSGSQDTITIGTSEFTSLNYVPQINSIPGRIIIQNGIATKDILKFDISKLPGKVIINQATLEMKIDWANSFYSKSSYAPTDNRLIYKLLTDTSTLTNDGIIYYSYQPDSNTYLAYISIAVQKWNYGSAANLGIVLSNIYEYVNIDRYVFYGPDYSDVSKRPRLKIRYSLKR
jgi:hypothetical protein